MNIAFVFFIIICVLLYSLRYCLLKGFKSKAANLIPADGKLYQTNQRLVYTEMFFIFLIFIGGIISQVIADRHENEQELLGIPLTAILIAIVLFSAVLTLPILQRYSSYFNWGKDILEYNIAFQNRLKDTAKLQKEDIASIQEADGFFKIHMKSGQESKIKIKNLELLNGFAILKDKLLAFNFEIKQQS